MKRKYSSLILVVILSFVILGLKFTHPQRNFISYDNFGYYMYLPANYIYNDLELKGNWYKEINEKYISTPTMYQILQAPNGALIIRFYRGMSILWTPAFFAGHIAANVLDYPADGFSAPYQWALVLFGALFSILGLVISRKILLHFFSEKVTTLTLLLTFAGTNLFFFMTLGSDVPHVYLFTLFAAVIWLSIKWHENQRIHYALGLGLMLGLILAIRPSDIYIGLIPVFWGVYDQKTFNDKINLALTNKLQIALALLIVACCFLPQVMYHHKYAGEFFVNVYNDAGSTLDLSNPRFAYVLFGFRKGWFIYSPLSLVAVFGLITCYRKFRGYFWPAVAFILINVYLIASFTSLVSYGWRAFLEMYAVLIIPSAYLIENLSSRKTVVKVFLGIVFLFFIVLNIHQAWQVRVGIIDGSRMTKNYYMAVLGKNKVSDSDRALLLVDRSATGIDKIPDNGQFNQRELVNLNFNDEPSTDSLAPPPFEGEGLFRMGEGVEFSPGIKIPYKGITSEYYCYLRGSVYVYSPTGNFSDKIFIVMTTLNGKKEHLKYRAINFNMSSGFVPGSWNKLTMDYMTPEVTNGNEIVNAYIWYSGSEKIWIDKFVVKAYTID